MSLKNEKLDFLCINCGKHFTSESHYVTHSVECQGTSDNVHAPQAMDDGGSTLPPLPMPLNTKGDYLQVDDNGISGSDSSSMLPPSPPLPVSYGPGNEPYLLSPPLQENAQAPSGPSGLESYQSDNHSLLEWFIQICCCCFSTTN